MDAFGERTGRHYRLVEYQRPPGGRAGNGADGVRGADRPRDRRAPVRRGERVGRAEGPPVPAVPGAGICSPPCPPPCGSIAVLDRTKEPGRARRAAVPRRGRGAPRGRRCRHRAAMPQVIGGRYGLSSKEFTPGMVSRRSSPSCARSTRADGSRSASPTMSPTPAWPMTRTSTSGPRDVRPASSGSAPTGRSARTRTAIKIIGAECRAACPGVLRLRLPQVGGADRLPPALRAGADPAPYLIDRAELRGLSPVRAARAGRGAGPGRARRDLAAEHARTRPRRSGTACPARCRSRSSPRGSSSTPSTPARWPARPACAGRINTVLQTCFFAISGVLPAEEAIAAIKAAIAQNLRRRGDRGGASATTPPWTASPHCTRSRSRPR